MCLTNSKQDDILISVIITNIKAKNYQLSESQEAEQTK